VNIYIFLCNHQSCGRLSHRHGYSNTASLDPTTTMEQAPLLYCRSCHTNKPSDQFKLRERNDNYGRKGEPTSQCSLCAAKKHNRQTNRKRKRDEDPSEDPAEPGPIMSIEQFTAMLHQRARRGDLCFRTHISTQGLAAGEYIESKIASARVWEATGIRFSSVWFQPGN